MIRVDFVDGFWRCYSPDGGQELAYGGSLGGALAYAKSEWPEWCYEGFRVDIAPDVDVHALIAAGHL